MVQFFLLYKYTHFPTKSIELSITPEKEHPCIVAENILNRHERTRNIGDSEIVVPVQLQDRQRDDRHDDHWLHHHQSDFKLLRVCARDLIRLPVCQV